MKGRKINDVTRPNLMRIIFVALLSLCLIGFPTGNRLLAQDDIYNRNELLSRIKLLRKNFEAASKKFQALRKKYELLFEETQAIEKGIKQEKDKIAQIKARREQELQKRLAAQKRIEESLMRKAQVTQKQGSLQAKPQSQVQRRKAIEQLLYLLESQKSK